MKNKVYFVNKLCQLKGVSPDSEEAQNMYSMKVVDLLIAIKIATPESPKETEEEDETLAKLLGCSN